ncbi:MAG: hypothetical protein AB1689_22435 [Thermodesulfobacteriota bacterium]
MKSERTSRGGRAALAIFLTLSCLAAALPARGEEAADFEESRSPWAVAPPIGAHEQPGVERDGTLRVIRFSNDRQILNDKGTVLGFAAIVARTGEIPATHERPLDEKSLLEIMRRGQGNAE